MGVLISDIEKFLNPDGYGYGNGYGYGYGYGYGNGYGYGYGDGNGYGNGNGNGYGNGYGDGISEFEGNPIVNIDGVPTGIEAIHGNYALGFTIECNWKRVKCFIARVGSFFAHGDTLKKAFADATAKYNDNLPTDVKIANFLDFCKGKEKIAAKDLFGWHHILTGSCEAGRRNFCMNHGIDISKDSFTLAEFIELTESSYGSSVIKELKKQVNL